MRYSIIIIIWSSILLEGCGSYYASVGEERPQSPLWQITMSDGAVIPQAELDWLGQDSLIISNRRGEQTIPVDFISEIRLPHGVSFFEGVRDGAKTGATIGVVLGGAVGLLSGMSISSHDAGTDQAITCVFTTVLGGIVGGAYLGIAGGVIGGVSGLLGGYDEVHDLSRMPLHEKLDTIRLLISRNAE